MRRNLSPLVHSFSRLLSVLVIVLFQLPTFSLAFEGSFKTYSIINNFSDTSSVISNSAANFAPLTVFSNTGSISVADRASTTSPNGISTPYPSTISVSGLSGTISDVNVTITGLTASRERDLNLVVVAPTGQALMIMADAGNLFGTSNVNLTFDDAAASIIPTSAAIVSGTYRPTDHLFSVTDSDVFPAPGPTSVNDSAPEGTATLASTFNGLSPNGTWSLYIVDDSLGGGSSTVSGGWSIDITASSPTAPTTTTISSNTNPALTTQTVTFTSTTTSGGNPVTTGTVSFTQNSVALCSNVAVNASGTAVCATTLPEGTRTVTATYNGTASFGQSNGSLTQIINSPTVVSGSQFCNNGGFTIGDSGAASVYPSSIAVSGLVGTINKVTVQLNGMTMPRASNLDFLLVDSGGRAFQIMSDTGDITSISGINLVLDDSAANQLPNGTALASGTFRPTDISIVGSPDTYPAPAPATFNLAAPAGTATFASVYNNTEPNGTWLLYSNDDSVGGGPSTVTSWCANFTLNKFSTVTSLTASSNPTPVLQNVTFTASVTANSPLSDLAPGTPTGSVEFFDGTTSLGTAALNGSGQASRTVQMLIQGTRSITARYLGANIGAGGGGYALSTSSPLLLSVTNPTAATVSLTGRVFSLAGRGVPGAFVTITDNNGNYQTAITNPFGYYRFDRLEAGAGYSVSVKAKNKQFSPKFVNVFDEVTGFDFVESPPQ